MAVDKIGTDADLRHAIRRLVRAGGERDAERREVIGVADGLKLRGLVPDNWQSDGSLKRSEALWEGKEQRETWNDLYTGLSAALDELYEDDDTYRYCYVWVQDFTDSEVIYSISGDLMSAPYTVQEGGPIEIGEPTKVRPVTEYVSTERSASTKLEWRKRRADDLKGLERRRFDIGDMEVRESDEGGWTLVGYASVTETPYEVGFYSETVKRGAFKRTLSENPDVTLLLNHEGLPLARTKSGTLTLEEDERGLRVEAELDPQDPDAQVLARKLKRGDLDGQMSMAFQVTDQRWSEDYDEREIVSLSLHRGDVSIVTQGASPTTSASLRALEAAGREGLCSALVEFRSGHLSESGAELLARLLDLPKDGGGSAALDGLLAKEADEPADIERDDPAPRERAVPDHTTAARQWLDALQMREAA